MQMHGGEVNGLYPKTATGDVVGLVIGGLQGPTENALNLDIDGVTFNNIIGLRQELVKEHLLLSLLHTHPQLLKLKTASSTITGTWISGRLCSQIQIIVSD